MSSKKPQISTTNLFEACYLLHKCTSDYTGYKLIPNAQGKQSVVRAFFELTPEVEKYRKVFKSKESTKDSLIPIGELCSFWTYFQNLKKTK